MADFRTGLGDSRGGIDVSGTMKSGVALGATIAEYYSGAGAPTSTTLATGSYVVGDLYYDTTNNVMYFCNAAGSKSTSTWVLLATGSSGSGGAIQPQTVWFGPISDQTITNTTSYAGLGWSAANEQDIYIMMARAGTFKNLTVFPEADPGSGNTYIVSLRQNGADPASGLTVTIDHTHYATAQVDSAHTVTVAVGDLIDVKIIGSASATGDTLQVAAVLV